MTNSLVYSALLAVIVAVLLFQSGNAVASCLGCVELDEITFDKLIPRFPYALVKFDIAFPYGEKHEAFASFSRTAHSVTNDLLIGLVGIKDYGEKENSALGKRFDVDEKAYPGIYLIREGNVENYVKYPAEQEITAENLKKFVTDNSNLYIGLEGCLKDFSLLVADFPNKSAQEQFELIEQASEMVGALKKETDNINANTYLTFMKKICDKGYRFVDEENARLTKLQKSKVSAAKKIQIKHKLNILQAFRVAEVTKKPNSDL